MGTRESFINQSFENLFKTWFHRTGVFGAVIFIALSLLDYISTPENFKLFLIYRILISSLLFILVYISKKLNGRNILYHKILAFTAIVSSAVTVELMILKFGGHASPYIAGLLVLGVCFIGFIPADLRFHIINSVSVFLIYLLPLLLLEGESVNIRSLIMSGAFMITVFAIFIYFRIISNRHLAGELELRHQLEKKHEDLERIARARTDDLMLSYDILKESENKFKSLFHHASDSIFLLDTDENMTIADANMSACKIHGYTKKELVGSPLSLLNDLKTTEKVPEMRKLLLKGLPLTIEGEHVKKDGTVFPVEISAQVVKISGKDYFLTIDRDITDRKNMEDQLVYQALYDSLTGLPNRILFMDRLKTNFARRKRQPDVLFSLLFIDIDHFKKINDSYGHLLGDRMLVEVVDRLKGSIRPGDTLSRFGGDEFLLILDEIGREDDAIAIIERIQEEMGKPFHIDNNEIYITLSIGISFSNIDYQNPEDMLRDTDNAMYNAKEQGRSCYVVFDKKMHYSSIESLKMENDLRKAVERNEFVLYYQPVVDITSLKITGFEALIRWEHPVYGLIYPDSFIHLAESTGLITKIGEWVLYEACSQISRWKKVFPGNELVVSVNLSVKQFNNNLPDIVANIIEDTEIDPENLRLEITESIMMGDVNSALELLNRLKEMKIQIYVDDFGTGYSSLNYIHKFPVDAIKIDRSFIENIMNDEESLEVVKAVSTIAQNLNLNLIAEGVETEEQLEIIRSLNCRLTQGFHFCEPLNSKMSEQYMRDFHEKYK